MKYVYSFSSKKNKLGNITEAQMTEFAEDGSKKTVNPINFIKKRYKKKVVTENDLANLARELDNGIVVFYAIELFNNPF
ncbi:MAG: hypothetical protein K6B70_03445 [Clostridia bacterium]|nr:hypothetical protein [Clostridia bacterium]